MLEWLRWIAVLPAAIVACCCAQLLIVLGTYLAYELEGRTRWPDWFYQLLGSIVLPISFIWAGAKVAPKYHFIVVLCLTVIFSCATAAILTYGVLIDYRKYPLWWFVANGFVGIISATIYCITFRNNRHGTDTASHDISE
jgi:uncharacterized membrane protein (DUF2068 family)